MDEILNALGCAVGVFIGHLLFDTSLIVTLGCWVVAFAVVSFLMEGV